jgi:hypothetical protein
VSIDQYKDKNRAELWQIVQIQAQVTTSMQLESNKLKTRVAELEKEKQTLIEQHDMWKQQWHELNDSLTILKLEHQAKGVDDFISPYRDGLTREHVKGGYGPIVLKAGRSEIKHLLSQAKALKEQDKTK